MPKLTRPQEQVLRIMRRHRCEIGEARIGGKTHLQYEPRVGKPGPRKATIRALHIHGFLRAYQVSWFCTVYALTYWGIQAAERLQEAQ